ncbi:MAG: hypothetical protein R3290_07535 [Acidimicrobiia bacterium]|nr:hypothetical protein [Acidimicrobiia bacterium]
MHHPGRASLVILLWFALASCISATPAEESGAAATAAVVRGLVDDPTTAVFLLPLSGSDPDLTLQAAVVAELDDLETVRFVDDAEEAFDGDGVRDGAVLLRVGSVPSGDRPVVTVERILSANRSTLVTVALERSGDEWRVLSVSDA